MKRIFLSKMFLVMLACFVPTASIASDDTKLIKAGSFTPLYGVENSEETLLINEFLLDTYPITNSQFAEFIKANPDWQPSQANKTLTDHSYLKHWIYKDASTKIPVLSDLKKPVINVSWFAAHDYCTWKGGRLPTVLEWEYAAAAGEKKPNESRDPAFIQKLLDWYSQPNKGLGEVGTRQPNYWGIHDLHGLVWEWTADFNSVFVVGDNRRDGESLEDLFCGAGAASGTDRANYAAYMRYAMRSSLKGHYTATNLGFRCAYNLKRGVR